MAQKTITTDDLDGSIDARPVQFSLFGVTHSIDLNAKHIAELKSALGIIRPILDAATIVQDEQPEQDEAEGSEANPIKVGIDALADLFSGSLPAVPAPATAASISYNLVATTAALAEFPACDEDTLSYSELRNRFPYAEVSAWALSRYIVTRGHAAKKVTLPKDVYIAYARMVSAQRHQELLQSLEAEQAAASAVPTKKKAKGRVYPKGLREWARANGYKVGNGAVASTVLHAYAKAHSN